MVSVVNEDQEYRAYRNRIYLEKIKERREARQKKDWHPADAIRKELEEKGIILEDKKDRTDWKVKVG